MPVKTAEDINGKMIMLASEAHQVQMAQDRSSLNSFLAVLSVKQVTEICTEMSGMAKKGSQGGDEGEVLLSHPAFFHSLVNCKPVLVN